MKLKTKYDAGDSVWIIDEGSIVNTVILGITVDVNNLGECKVHYHFGHHNPPMTKLESKIFKDKEEIIEYVKKLRG